MCDKGSKNSTEISMEVLKTFKIANDYFEILHFKVHQNLLLHAKPCYKQSLHFEKLKICFIEFLCSRSQSGITFAESKPDIPLLIPIIFLVTLLFR